MTYRIPNIQINFNEKEKYSAMGGALLISTIFEKYNLRETIDEYIGARKGGCIKYIDSSYIESLVTMQILGGEAVDDMKIIRGVIISNMLGGIPGKSSIHNFL